jgi:hypothetical protein
MSDQSWDLPEPKDILIADEIEIVPLDEASMEDYPDCLILDEREHVVSDTEDCWCEPEVVDVEGLA